MQCTRPVAVFNDQGFMHVPCGKCPMCKIAKTREWAVRVGHELLAHKDALFATLTYRDEDLPIEADLSKHELTTFIKRLRRHLEPQPIRYIASGEYGDPTKCSPLDPNRARWLTRGFARPHYHMIIFGLSLDRHQLVLVKCDTTDAGWKSLGGPLNEAWKKGFIVVGTVTYESAAYVVRYLEKKYDPHTNLRVYQNLQAPFQLQSQGLGKTWMTTNQEQLRRELGLRVKGKHIGLPRYYQQKILVSDSDKARLYAKAEQAELDGRYYWARKGIHNGYEQRSLVQGQRLQHQKNVLAYLEQKRGQQDTDPKP